VPVLTRLECLHYSLVLIGEGFKFRDIQPLRCRPFYAVYGESNTRITEVKGKIKSSDKYLLELFNSFLDMEASSSRGLHFSALLSWGCDWVWMNLKSAASPQFSPDLAYYVSKTGSFRITGCEPLAIVYGDNAS
jgi:hypothetical protein